MNLDMFMETEQGNSTAHGHTEEAAWVQSWGRPWACASCCVLICNLLVHCCPFHSEREIIPQEWPQSYMMLREILGLFFILKMILLIQVIYK